MSDKTSVIIQKKPIVCTMAVPVPLVGGTLPAHSHSGADITSGTVDPARLGSGTPNSATLLDGSGAWRTLAVGDLPAHSHSGADITSGTVAPARLGSGTPNSATLLDGSGAWRTLAVGDLPAHSHSGADITSGTVAPARLGAQSLSGLRNSQCYWSLAASTGAITAALIAPSQLTPGGWGTRFSATEQPSAQYNSDLIPLDYRKAIKWRFWAANSGAVAVNCRMYIYYYDSSGAFLGSSTLISATPSTGAGTIYSGVTGAPGAIYTGVAYCQLVFFPSYTAFTGSWSIDLSILEFGQINPSCSIAFSLASLTNGATSQMVFQGESHDTADMRRTSQPNRVYLPIDGRWAVGWGVTFPANATGYRMIRLHLNGSIMGDGTWYSPTVSGAAYTAAGHVTKTFAAEDYLELYASQGSGSTLSSLTGWITAHLID